MKKIAVYAKPLSDPGFNGVIQYSRSLLNAISKIDHDNEYHLFSNQTLINPPQGKNFIPRKINLPKLWVQIGFPLYFLKEKFDLYFSVKEVLPFNLFRPRGIVVCHDLAILPDQKVSFNGRLFNWLAIHQVIKGADLIITDAHSTKLEIIKLAKIPPDKIKVIHLSHDNEHFYPRPLTDVNFERVKKKCDIKGNYILSTASTIWSRKNILRIVQSFAAFKKTTKSELELVLTGRKGDPLYYQEVVREIEKLDMAAHIHLCGGVSYEELPFLYSGAEALFFPSLHEGFGIPILEAMSCGIPVITSNLSAMPEVAGDGALIVDPYQLESMVEALCQLVKSPHLKQDLIKKGHARSAQFSWQKTAQETLSCFGI